MRPAPSVKAPGRGSLVRESALRIRRFPHQTAATFGAVFRVARDSFGVNSALADVTPSFLTARIAETTLRCAVGQRYTTVLADVASSLGHLVIGALDVATAICTGAPAATLGIPHASAPALGE